MYPLNLETCRKKKERIKKKTECKTDSDEDKHVEGLEEASTGNAENVHLGQ